MAQFIAPLPQQPKQKSTGERLLEGLMGAGLSFPEALGDYQKNLQQQEFSKLLSPHRHPSRQEVFSGSQEGNLGESVEDPYSTVKAAVLAGAPKEIVDILNQEAKEKSEREYLPKKEYQKKAAEATAKFDERLDLLSHELPSTEYSLALLEDALTGTTGWDAAGNRLAEITGLPSFRTAKGAEAQSAIKQYFLGDLSSIKGGRANILIEKNLLDAYPNVGYDPIANQKIMVGMRMKKDIQSLELETAERLKEKYLKKLGYVPGTFKDEVKFEVKNKAKEIEKRAIDQMHKLNEIGKVKDKFMRSHLKSGEVLMMSPEGEPFAVPESELEDYKSQGYMSLGKKS